MFSSRLPGSLARNRLSLAVERARTDARPFTDLTESNPTRAGFSYPPGLLEPLAQHAALRYEPEPLGMFAGRQAASGDFLRRGIPVPPERSVITASTSEAYSVLFKLLCDPGDTVLAPRPSYPLVEHLTRLDAVGVEPYDLEYHGRWSIDVDRIRRALEHSSRTRAVIVVSPNNPTGSIVSRDELDAISSLCRKHGTALIADEVFADYPLQGRLSSVLLQNDALTFGLGGLSKSVGLPQIKLGWIGVNGPDDLVRDALERLETICDTYLSVSTPAQVAAASLLTAGASVRSQICARVVENHRALSKAVEACPACSLLHAEGGWYGVVQVPATRTEEALVLDLLQNAEVLVHPGYFFDFQREAFIVVSLLPEPQLFVPAIARMLAEIARVS
jgi:aspartate/methionine/tyrosine aminotransferase